ncbi:MAG: 50S ribosomal protein L15 [Candidatus Eremiobacteraeota bacterium]|nr:50S ribosomal protein L15 [Candidatus Eremiobacteraeota bacterium]
MQLSDLRPAKNSTKRVKRVGRGHGCHVKTAGKGSKGQNSRSGGGKTPGFEGGQTPWYRRLPKFKGFRNPFKTVYTVVGLSALEECAEHKEITPDVLLKEGFVRNLNNPIKVLANGTIEKAVTVKLHKFSKTAQEAIEKAGGKIEVI